jgi:hypothetical protein
MEKGRTTQDGSHMASHSQRGSRDQEGLARSGENGRESLTNGRKKRKDSKVSNKGERVMVCGRSSLLPA